MPRRGFWITAILATFATPVLGAQPGWPGYGQPYPSPPLDSPSDGAPSWAQDPRQGRIEVATFLANSPNAGRLGHGSIVIAPSAEPSPVIDDATFETALVDQLTRAGYDAGSPSNADGQVMEFVVRHEVVRPPEPPHSPVSGGVAVGAGNRGSGLGLALAIDLSKPLGPLVATRLEARIRDKTTKELLWQGRAEVLYREGNKHWREGDVATKLTAALFKGFPRPQTN